MFNRYNKRFAFQFEGGPNDWEGWTPPWMRHGHGHGRGGHGPHFFEARMRHGFFGPRGPFGPGHEGGRFFGRGDVKYALLELVQERPMHGYEMMKALEERSGGFYTPSAGTIYPTLQMLEDRGLVTFQEVEGKKVYSITEAGKAYLAERQKGEEDFTPPWARKFAHAEHWQHWNTPEIQALRSEAFEVTRLFAIGVRTSVQNPQKLAQLRSILERARQDLAGLIYENTQAPEQPENTTDTNNA
jgi:DNA-binding PadR family transcriptional regulator